jgi:hypothetical protein
LPIGPPAAGHKNNSRINISMLSLLTYGQFWLIPLGDDFQCGYVTKSRKFKKKKTVLKKNGVKL